MISPRPGAKAFVDALDAGGDGAGLQTETKTPARITIE
jgi:hypothetical protein